MDNICATCKGKGIVRMWWNEGPINDGYHRPYFKDRYRDEWCRRCDGKGIAKAGNNLTCEVAA